MTGACGSRQLWGGVGEMGLECKAGLVMEGLGRFGFYPGESLERASLCNVETGIGGW